MKIYYQNIYILDTDTLSYTRNRYVQLKAVQEENKMGIDKETTPTSVNIVLDNKPTYIEELKKQADEDGQNEEKDDNKLSLTLDKHNFDMEEYYYDEDDNTIIISGSMISSKGETYINIIMPLSDILLVDIMQGAIKKLNKLKTALESLK